MDEFLIELDNFKYNLNIKDLDEYKLEERIEEINKNNDEIEKINSNIDKLKEKLKDKKNYNLYNSKEVMYSAKDKLNEYLKEAELKEINNNSLIQNINIEIEFAKDDEIKEYKELELKNAQEKIEFYKKNIENYDKLFSDFDQKMDDQFDSNNFKGDQRAVKYGEKLVKALETRNKILNNNYDEELDTLIDKSKNGEYTYEKAKEHFINFRMKLNDDFFDMDLSKRKSEINENKLAQEYYQDLIDETNKKMSDEKNYYQTPYQDELLNEQNEKWNGKFYDIAAQVFGIKNNIKKIENDIIDYKNIISLCTDENTEIDQMIKSLNANDNKSKKLRDRFNQNRHQVEESEFCLEELNVLLQNYNVDIQLLEIRKERVGSLISNLNIGQKDNKKDSFKYILDETRLRDYKSGLVALKNRENYLKTSLMETIERVDGSSKKKEDNKNEKKEIKKPVESKKEVSSEKEDNKNKIKGEVSEIASIKRPIKEKIKNKLRKVSNEILIKSGYITEPKIEIENPFATKVEEKHEETKVEEKVETKVNKKETKPEVKEDIKEKEEVVAKEEIVIDMHDLVTIQEGAGIYKNQYDATNQKNPFNPIIKRAEEREVMGITIKTLDGSLKFVQNNDLKKRIIDDGGVVTSYLTGQDGIPEGFWNESKIIKVEEKEKSMERGSI